MSEERQTPLSAEEQELLDMERGKGHSSPGCALASVVAMVAVVGLIWVIVSI